MTVTGSTRRQVKDGHYGLIGMRERAAKVGANLSVESGEAGTTVSLEWGPR